MIPLKDLRAAAALSSEVYIAAVEQTIAGAGEHRFSPEFEREMGRLIRKTRHPYLRRALRRAAAVILAATVGSGVWLAVDVDSRAAVFGWFREVYQWFVAYRYSEQTGINGRTDQIYDSPTWIPEGYELIAEENADGNRVLFYMDEAGNLLKFVSISETEKADLFAWEEDAVVESVNVGGYMADLILLPIDREMLTVVWTDRDGRLFCVSGRLRAEELLRVAESVYQKNN